MIGVMVPCPVCHGTRRRPVSDEARQSADKYGGFYGYDAETGTSLCDNCGGQYMSLTPLGEVMARSDGTGCVHEYSGEQVGNCLWKYTCKWCRDTYRIDSGD